MLRGLISVNNHWQHGGPRFGHRTLDHDLHYIEGWSLWLDARIVLRTLVREFILGSAD